MPIKPVKKNQSLESLTEKQLAQRLALTIIAIFVVGAGSVVGVFVFGPKIGAIFGLINKNQGNGTTKDTRAPEPPVIYDFPEATKETTVSIKGFAEAGSTVKLFVNGPEVQSTVSDANGQFTFSGIQLNDGKNTFFAKATDQSGNESEKSANVFIDVDSSKPKIEIDSPKNGDTVRNLDKRITIKGKVSEKGTLKINSRLVVIKPDLSFDFILGVDEGEQTLTFQFTDLAGNIKEEKIRVTYEKRGI